MEESLHSLVQDLQKEMENIAARGIRAIEAEQLRWLKSNAGQLAAMGAQHLADRITRLTEAMEADHKAPARLYELLTTLKVFERVLTLETAQAQLTELAQTAEESSD
ncbi:MAG: hypothetical protein AAF394_13860 [Planctomycetota bacterium]